MFPFFHPRRTKPARAGAALTAGALIALWGALPAQAQHLGHHKHHDQHIDKQMNAGRASGHTGHSTEHSVHGIHHTPPPIGVMGAHLPKRGEVMLNAQYMRMEMNDLTRGSNKVSESDVLALGYRVIPTEMTGQMYMLGGMVGITSRLAIMAMVPWVEKTMSMTTYNMMGTGVVGDADMTVKGIGDVKVGALAKVYRGNGNHVHAGLGLSLPSGSLDNTVTHLNPMGNTVTMRAGYAMQLGSGTVDLIPNLAYMGGTGKFTWGAKYEAVLRLENRNSEGYRHGDIHKATAWAGYRWAPWISSSLRIEGMNQGSIVGEDPFLAPHVRSVGANPDNVGGKRVDAILGINLMGTSGALKGMRLGVEYGIPLYEKVNGVRLGVDNTIRVGVTKKF